MESILTSIKKLLGIEEDYEHFDADIIVHINSAFATLSQIGVGPEGVFAISDKFSTWSEFSESASVVELSKQYIFLKTKIVFDPPLSSTVTDSIKQTISELEWRLNVMDEATEPN